MKIFGKKNSEEPKRTIEDILTPKDSEESVENAEMEENVKESVGENVEIDTHKEIKIESKEESSFNALTCFGWSESRTPKWLIKSAHIWYGAMSFLWFLLGALTFAPIIFISKKFNVIFKNKITSLVVAILVWCGIVLMLVGLFSARNKSEKDLIDTKEEAVVETVETVKDTIANN